MASIFFNENPAPKKGGSKNKILIGVWGRTDERTDERTERTVGGGGRTGGQPVGRSVGRPVGRSDGRTDGRTAGPGEVVRGERWTDGWMDLPRRTSVDLVRRTSRERREKLEGRRGGHGG